MKQPRPYPKWRKDAEHRWRDAFHTFGHILMTHARDEALAKIPASASAETREVAEKAVQEALYNLMMILEGVVGPPAGSKHRIEFALTARVLNADSSEVVEQYELAPDGAESACMGFHFWAEGDFKR